MKRVLKPLAIGAAFLAWASGTYACTLAAYRSANELMRVPAAIGVIATSFAVGAFFVGLLASIEGD